MKSRLQQIGTYRGPYVIELYPKAGTKFVPEDAGATIEGNKVSVRVGTAMIDMGGIQFTACGKKFGWGYHCIKKITGDGGELLWKNWNELETGENKSAVKDELLFDRIAQLAEVVVLAKLKLGQIVEDHEATFLPALVAVHRISKGDDDKFLSHTVSWCTSLILGNTNRKDYLSAIDWARKEFKEVSAPRGVLVLSMLMFLVQRGCEKAKSESAEEQAIWQEISKRIKSLLEQ